MSYFATPQYKNLCPGGQEINNFSEAFLGHHNYKITCLFYAWEQRRKFFNKYINFILFTPKLPPLLEAHEILATCKNFNQIIPYISYFVFIVAGFFGPPRNFFNYMETSPLYYLLTCKEEAKVVVVEVCVGGGEGIIQIIMKHRRLKKIGTYTELYLFISRPLPFNLFPTFSL